MSRVKQTFSFCLFYLPLFLSSLIGIIYLFKLQGFYFFSKIFFSFTHFFNLFSIDHSIFGTIRLLDFSYFFLLVRFDRRHQMLIPSNILVKQFLWYVFLGNYIFDKKCSLATIVRDNVLRFLRVKFLLAKFRKFVLSL